MSFSDDFDKELEKLKKKKKKKTSSTNDVAPVSDLLKRDFGTTRLDRITAAKEEEEDDIAPLKQLGDDLGSTLFDDKWDDMKSNWKKNTEGMSKLEIAAKFAKAASTPKEEERKWFDTGAFDDGYDLGDVSKTILGTLGDVGENLGAGIIGMGEKALDAMAWMGNAYAKGQYYQNGGGYNIKQDQMFEESHKAATKATEEFIAKDLYDEEEVAKAIITNPLKNIGIDAEEDSVLGEKSDSLVQSAGQLAAQFGLQAVGVPWFVTSGVTSFGSEAENALNQGASFEEAGLSGAISAGAEILTEKLFGGDLFVKNAGADFATKYLSRAISNKTVRTLAKLGIDAAGEGFEEVASEFISNLGSSLYKEEDLGEILFNEDALDGYIESFIGGGVLGGGMGAINAIQSNKQGKDYTTGLTENEQKVVDKVYKDRVAEAEKEGKVTEKEKSKIYDEVLKEMEKGYISTDTIEEVLGGDTYQTYKDTIDSEDALQKEYDILYNMKQGEMTAKQTDRLTELREKLKEIQANSQRNQLKTQLSEEVSAYVARDRLAESYSEQVRRQHAFEADLTKYDAKQQAVIQKAIDSGILNNTNRTHEFVDMVAKISADKGVLFDFTNNAKLKESGFAVDGKFVNGYVTKDGVTVNIQSAKSLNSIVGHEITHVLEGTEVYDALKQTIFDYAKGKGEYDSRYKALAETYKNVKDADIDAELTADLVGDYLFTDSDFVKRLSTENRNVFQKIWDEVKYLAKVATAGSKEARQLAKVQKAFEDAYRESGKTAEETQEAETQYSVTVTDQDTVDFLDNQEHIVTYKAMQVIDGKLYPPMAAKVKDENGKYRLTNPSQLGVWQQATEDPANIKKFKGDVGYYTLNKGDGSSVDAAYNPYEHSSNLVLNDQFESAHRRDNIVTVEGIIPASEMTSGYKAQYAKDSTGVMDWHSGVVASKLKDNKRQVYLSRYFKPVRILPDSEVASKYKEVLEGSGVPVPFNVVTPSLLAELEKAGVDIDYEGTPMYQYHAKKAAEKAKYSLGYHAGDLGKAESLRQQGLGRDTGHFGTGTYFVGNKAAIEGYNTRNGKPAPVEAVDFDQYNLFKPKNAHDGFALHDFLRGVDGYWNRDADAVATMDEYESLQAKLDDLVYDIESEEFGETDPSKESWLNVEREFLSDAKRMMGGYKVGTELTGTLNRLTDGNFQYDPRSEEYYSYDFDTDQFAYYTEEEIIQKLNAEEGGWRAFENIAKMTDDYYSYSRVSRYETWQDSVPEVARIFGVSEQEVRNLIKGVTEDINARGYTDEDMETADSAATRLMKALGYEGIDVRGIKELDNTSYGSVIYDLKGEDLARKKEIGTARYSLSDSAGRQLTNEQADYFRDSKARDEDGSLKVVYHGTRNADFTVFKRNVNYFTDSKEMASSYSPNGDMFEGYVNITKPYEIDAQGEKWSRIPIDDATKKFLQEYGASVFKEGGKWRTTPADLASAIEEAVDNGDMDHDGIIIKNIDDTGSYYKGKGENVATDYIVFNSNQFKNADNKAPTADRDIRFSLSEPVEETKDLMAIHNLHTNEVLKQLEMGGMPYPSVAITNPSKIAHEDFGEISLVLQKDAVDPKKNRYNHIYSSDAYTPTFPHVSYEASRDAADRVIRTVNGQFNKIPDFYRRNVGALRDYTNLNDYLNRWGGEQGVVSGFADDYGMRQIYLAEKGEAVPVEIVRTETQMTDYQKALYQKVVDKIGADTLAQLNDRGYHPTLGQARIEWTKKHIDTLKDIYAEDWSADGTVTKAEALEIADSEKLFYWYKEAVSALEYLENGGTTVVEKEDFNATNAKIDEKIAGSDYPQWLANLFSGIEGQSGIRNDKDTFTPRGNRRSFSQLHDPVTIDNVIKAMRKKEQTGQGAFGTSNFGGASVQEYGSIAEAKRNSNMLGVIDETEYKAIKQRIDDQLRDIAMRYSNGGDIIDAKGAIVEAVAKNESKAGIERYLKQYDYVFKYADGMADEIVELRDYVRSLPRPYFEAKPRRAVGFDEVAVFVIPRNADVKLKQELLNRGYSIAEYDPDVEGDRQRVVNQFEEFKFSLSDVGQTHKQYGRWNVYGKDILLDKAPVQDSLTTEETGPVTEETAPVTEETDLFPDDVSRELDNLYQQKDELESMMMDAVNGGNFDAFEQINVEYESVMERISQAEEADSGRVDSLTDADVPPEMEAPYSVSQPEYVDDPFEDRDYSEVGNRKVKAYQYENPEVKPFFLDAAYGMGYDLANTTRGERIYNDQLHYDSGGEKGWMGTKRHSAPDLEMFKDTTPYTWDEIIEAVNDIIEDNGKENNACSKRIEFLLNDRLMKGYTDVDGREIPPNQEYIDFLYEKQITEYSNEAFDALMAQADQYAPVAEESTETEVVAENATTTEAPVAEQYEAIRPKRERSTEPRMVRADTDSRGKERKWVGTSTESEAVDGKVLPEDLNQELTHYQPISNKKTLGNANAKLSNMGYESSVVYFNSQFANRKTSLDDIALGERLIQEAVKKGDYKTAGELIQNVAILGTELGQKVQALSIIKRLTPEGQLKMLQKTVERGKTKGDKAFEGVEVTQDMIEELLKVYNKDGSFDQQKLNEAVERVKKGIADQMQVTKMEKVNAWRYLSMLGNPKTHIRNLVSNVAMKGTVAVKNALARTVEDIAPIKNRTKTWKAASEDVKKFAQRKTIEMKDVISGDSKYSDSASIKDKRAIFKNKILNGLYEFNSDMLGKEDWWFSKGAFQSSLSEFLTANGIRSEQDIKRNPEIVAKGINYAVEQSQIATFRQYSWLANKINEIERKNVATDIAVGSVLPFKKTPINIAKTGLNYSPLGFAKTLTYDVSQVKKGNMEASELVDHLAQNVTGSALTLVGYMLASAGFLNGSGDDDKEGKYDYQLGKQAYSINIGDATYSLSWLSPVAMPLFVGANAYEQLVEGKEWNGDVVIETLAQTLDPLSEMSFLSSLDSVLSSYDSGIMKFAGIAQTAAQSYVGQFVPTLSSQLAATLDDTKRTTKVSADSENKFFDEVINSLKYKIPGLRETLEPSTDIWGNEVKQTEDVITRAVESFLAPWAKREDISTEIDEEIKDLYGETGDDGLIPSIPDNYVNYDGEKYEMSAKEFTDFKKMYGQTAAEMLEELFDTDTYQEADSETRADMVNRVYDYARDEARREFFDGRGIDFTNATEEGEEVYKENPIKGAIENDMPVDEYVFSEEYPEKYEFLNKNGVTYNDYQNGSDDFKDAWSWAYKNPEKFTLSKAVSSDVVEYRKITGELYDIKADKDENGKSISGSRKEKVIEYINNLDADYGEKIILFKSEYNADDTYNYEIIDYLNSREDISYEEMETILKELGFNVSSNGTITWD